MVLSRIARTVRLTLAALAAGVILVPAPALAQRGADHPRLDKVLNERAARGQGHSRVIVTLRPGFDIRSDVRLLGGAVGRRLPSIDGIVVELPNGRLKQLASHPAVLRLHWDRPAAGTLNHTAVTVGSTAVQALSGYTGAGVGVAVIDSGITSWHNDLTITSRSLTQMIRGGQRVTQFVDFVKGHPEPYDDNGHGTHVAGIIAGNGYESFGARAGIAPGAHIVALKVLDADGRGVISDVIAAIEYAIANRAAHNIRIINLSVGAAVTESYHTDPLTRATKRAVDAGLVVVAAAGNLGRNASGQVLYGGIGAPGNAPWVLTVGAHSHNGTIVRSDDTIAPYSSRGPSAIDYAAKPDLVAPGTGIVSLADPTSTLYRTKPAQLVSGLRLTAFKPYLSLTGTSMAAPVVSGTVALMLQANPALTPNLVKAILQYTSQKHAAYDPLTQGAGFLDAYGAVRLARFFAVARPGLAYPSSPSWSRQIFWGNYRLTGGVINHRANAWETGTVWGAAADRDGDNIVWGTLCGSSCDNIVWGTADDTFENIVWGTLLDADGENIVWGTFRDGDNIVWGTAFRDGENIVWGTADRGENIVWGTLDRTGDNIVWGTLCGGNNCDNIVWGTMGRDGENIVWGTGLRDGENIVWGTAGLNQENIVWGTGLRDGENIVWGTGLRNGENIVWGTSGDDEGVVWGGGDDGWAGLVFPPDLDLSGPIGGQE